ncbi:hypothetical protein IFM89_007938 [Coptis chinensis]|uniref:Uncharacterized protein n=1 Tax=Coptis chinensis TaxID=261450 RepID=A0A835IN61_9MAGN|nr:hypothetical protein IFM89_007938 [Coptis chinensis]
MKSLPIVFISLKLKLVAARLCPNVPTCNYLLIAFLLAHRFPDSYEMLQSILFLGLQPYLQTYKLLLICFIDRRIHGDMLFFPQSHDNHWPRCSCISGVHASCRTIWSERERSCKQLHGSKGRLAIAKMQRRGRSAAEALAKIKKDIRTETKRKKGVEMKARPGGENQSLDLCQTRTYDIEEIEIGNR